MTDRIDAGSANEPGWLAHARADLGLREKAGAANDARVLSYFAEVGRPDVKQDSTAWCAAAHFAWHRRAGAPIPPPDKVLLARSALGWGTKLDAPRLGCTAVFSRGAARWQGHVGIVVGWNATHIRLLSGNQNDRVTIAQFPRSALLGLRWPPSAAGASPMPRPPAPPPISPQPHKETQPMTKTKSPLESLGSTGPALGFLVWALNRAFGSDVLSSGDVTTLIDALSVVWTAGTAIYGRWRATKVVVVGGGRTA